MTSSKGLDAVRAYTQRSNATLTTPNRRYCAFTLHDLGTLLDLLGRGSAENKERGVLKSLTVIVHVLSRQMMDVLAKKVPQPESLKVIF